MGVTMFQYNLMYKNRWEAGFGPQATVYIKNFKWSGITHQIKRIILGSNALGSQIFFKKWLSITERWKKHYSGNQKTKALDLSLVQNWRSHSTV